MVLLRKLLHTFLGVALAFAAPYMTPLHAVYVAAALTMLIAGAYLIRRLDAVRKAERASYGEFFFALGVAVVGVAMLPEHTSAFQAGMLALALADPLASIVGRRWGTHVYHIFGEKRTIEGSMACVTVSTLILTIFGVPTVFGVGAALVVAAVEAIAPRGSDNLFLPLAASIAVVALT